MRDMKEVLFQEIFSKTGLDNVWISGCDALEKYFPTSDEFDVKETVLRNPFVQKALLEELILTKSCDFDNVSLNHQFFTSNTSFLEELQSILKKLYWQIVPIKRDGKLIGYSVSATSSIALAAIQELYSNNDIDMSFRRFLSLDGEPHHRMRDGSVMLVEKVGLAEKDRLNLNDNTLFKIIVNDLNIIGISCFFNNRLSEDELENDSFIQGLIENGSKVYLYKEEGKEILQVFVKKSEFISQT